MFKSLHDWGGGPSLRACPLHFAPRYPHSATWQGDAFFPLPSRILTSKDAGFLVRDDPGNAVSCATGTLAGFDVHVVGGGKAGSFKTAAAAETREEAARARRTAKRKAVRNG